MDERSAMREPARRKLLGGGAALLGGALGLGWFGRRATQAEAPLADHGTVASAAEPPTATTTLELTLFGANWRLRGEGHRATWARPEVGQRQVVYGELLDGPSDAAGAKVGEFYATCTCVDAPFGAGPLAASFVEYHTLNLADGTLTAMGTSYGEENVFAVVGGTGRYLGARGSYVARQAPVEWGGDGTAELTMTLLLDSTARTAGTERGG